MAFHIGKIIEKRLKECGMAKSELARRAKVSPQLIQSILKRPSIDTDVLRRVSVVLDYDFFIHYMGPSKGNVPMTAQSGAMVEELQKIKEEINVLARHNGYLRELMELMDVNFKNKIPVNKTITQTKSSKTTKPKRSGSV